MSSGTLRSSIRRLVSFRARVLATGLTVLLFVLGWVAFLSPYWRHSFRDDIARTLLNTDSDVGYVNDADCRACHAEIAETYARSEMARSWSVPSPEHFSLAPDDTQSVDDPKLKLRYRVLTRGRQLLQEEFRSESQSSRPHSLIRPVSYVVGSGSHGYSFVSESNGFLTLLPLGWYSEASKWDLSPGYERHNARFDREVPLECASCHNDIPDHIAGSRNRYRLPLPDGIGCQRCHGPGELHVKTSDPLATAGGSHRTIVNPARLPADRQDDVCLQCHLISDITVLSDGKDWNSFRPGQRLQDSRRDLFLKPEDPAQFGFSSHATRLRLSRCWTDGSTRGSLTCIACHDPHSALREVPRSTYIERCLQCHKEQDCRRPQPDAQPGRDCIDCHMRRGTPSNVAHTVFTDHWIRARPQPQLPAAATVRKPATQQPVRFIEFLQGTQSPAPEVHAIAVAKYFDIRRAPDRRQAQRELQDALKQYPNSPILHFWHGVTLESMRQWKPALEAYQRAAEHHSDPLTLNGVGAAQRGLGLLKEATATFRDSVARYPDFLLTYSELAEAYVTAGNLPAAVKALDQSLKLFPFQPETSVRRAHLGFLAGDPISDVRDRIDEAMQLEPDSPSLYWLLGQCLENEGETDRSIRAYETALEIDPRFVAALLSLGPALLQAGRIDEAEKRLNQLRVVAPNHPMLPGADSELRRLRSKRNE